MPITLVLTRKPNDLYKDGSRHGRFGTLIVLKGEKIANARIVESDSQGNGSINVPSGVLDLETPGAVEEVGRYTTMERMDGYVQLPPGRYAVSYEMNNPVVAKLKHGGNCFRVHGGHTPQQRGILIREAPHVGWLIGCIGPRKLKDRHPYTDTSLAAMMDLHKHVGDARADFLVLDW